MQSPDANTRAGSFAIDNRDGVSIHVRVTPRSSKTGIKRVGGPALELAVAAPPADGAANQQVQKLLAKLLGIAPSRIALIRGARSRHKTFQIGGMTASQARERLG